MITDTFKSPYQVMIHGMAGAGFASATASRRR